MDDAAKRHKSERDISNASKDNHVCDELVNTKGSGGLEDNSPRPLEENAESNELSNEKDVEATERTHIQANDLVAKEDYSVFTVPQKRAIILAGSFISWFSPMTGSIYYPALDQVRYLSRDFECTN